MEADQQDAQHGQTQEQRRRREGKPRKGRNQGTLAFTSENIYGVGQR